ncbi:hypothetical protein ACQY0O_006703 [Thecaphora frezii]
MASFEGTKLIKVSAKGEGYISAPNGGSNVNLLPKSDKFIVRRSDVDRYQIVLASNPELGLSYSQSRSIVQLTKEPSEFVIFPAPEAKSLNGAHAVYIRPVDYEENDEFLSMSPFLIYPPFIGIVSKFFARDQYWYFVDA